MPISPKIFKKIKIVDKQKKRNIIHVYSGDIELNIWTKFAKFNLKISNIPIKIFVISTNYFS